jgi:cytosine deaminase
MTYRVNLGKLKIFRHEYATMYKRTLAELVNFLEKIKKARVTWIVLGLKLQLVIRNARIRRREGVFDIAIDEGTISEISKDRISQSFEHEINANGMLVTNSFVNAHVHLDKCLTNEWVRSTANAMQGSFDVIPLAKEIKRKFTESDIVRRASEAIRNSVIEGSLAIRGFGDVDSVGELKAVKALLEVKRNLEPFVDLQVVAFPQEGILRDPGSEELLYKAMELGSDIVGGIPWYELDTDQCRKHIDIIFEIAKKYQRGIHVLVDDNEDPNSRCLEYLILKTLKERYFNKVAASHCRGALDSPDDRYASMIIKSAKEAAISVVENPHISLLMYGRMGTHPRRRGITRVKEFLSAGVNVAIGQDDIADPYYPFGRGDMQELAFFMIHGAHLCSPSEIETAFDMICENGARAMGLQKYGMKPGDDANLVILNASTVIDAFRLNAEKSWVIRKGVPLVRRKCEVIHDFPTS